MVYKTLHRKLKNEQHEPTKNKQWSTKHCTGHWRMSNTNPTKNKQWFTKHHTEHWRMSNTNPLKTNNGLQNTTHRKTARFSSPTLGRHISTFRGYQILFSIRNPLIYKSLHQSFFYSFITILPSESAVLYSTVIFLNHNIIILESGSFRPVKWVDSPHLIAIIL